MDVSNIATFLISWMHGWCVSKSFVSKLDALGNGIRLKRKVGYKKSTKMVRDL